MKQLRGQRYLAGANPDFVEIITKKLLYYDFDETVQLYDYINKCVNAGTLSVDDLALMGCNDRYFLLTALCQRKDALHPWLFDRCREVEASPDGHLDLWARYHYKSTIITYAGTIQDIVCDPDMTSAIISVNEKVAKKFLVQIKQTLESNILLKRVYADCLYEHPKRQSPKWSADDGIVVRRSAHNTKKEATVERIGLVEGLPAGPHFEKLLFDDAVTQKSVTNAEMIEKVSEAEELADNIGIGIKTRKQYVGTRYLHGDTYQQIIDRGDVTPRLYPATHNGKLTGTPVFLTEEAWTRVKKTQRRVVAAQHLMNPAAGNEASFDIRTFRPYTVRPSLLNIYILGDPSKAGTEKTRSDRTAFAVIGVDVNKNMYLLDGYRHRMGLTERWEKLHELYKRWFHMPGVQNVEVGYERYGMQSDIDHFNQQMLNTSKYLSFHIEEVSWPKEGGPSKRDRVERLEPELNNSKFYFPGVVWHEHYTNSHTGNHALWSVNEETLELDFRHMADETRAMKAMRLQRQPWRIVEPIICRDEDNRVYDLTRVALEELRFFPFGSHDDMADAMSRIYDMDYTAPAPMESSRIDDTAYPDT